MVSAKWWTKSAGVHPQRAAADYLTADPEMGNRERSLQRFLNHDAQVSLKNHPI